MPIKRKYLVLGISSFLLILEGCFFKKPEFPIEPFISFQGFQKITIKDNQNNPLKDSIVISINFRDGDGDLGLGPTETQPPFHPTEADSITPNKFYNNYFCTMYRKEKGEFVAFEFPDPSFTNNGRFPLLNDDDKLGPLEGVIDYSINIPLQNNLFKPNDTLKFEIQIVDRALHLSNVVESNEIVVKQTD